MTVINWPMLGACVIGNVIGGLSYAAVIGWDSKRFAWALVIGTAAGYLIAMWLAKKI